ncbi:MAG: pyridoxal phosphate-dependent aminotransferase [Bryobacteraceae bacterium]|nr:pyridoxal phosphate-dependent aminotransferase [Bryobacteraceae bacterium]
MPERLSLLKPTAINSILAEVQTLQVQGRKVASLMRGEPDFPTPAHITDAAIQALQNGRTAYPNNRGEAALRDAVADKLARQNGVTCDPGSEILITDGATLAIHAALGALVGPGDEVLVPDPIYDAYQSPIRFTGAEPRPVRSTSHAGRFAFHVDDLEAACTPATRVLLINTPWNPVGTVLTREELSNIAEFVCRRDLTLISDEIYESITYDGAVHISPASLSPEIRRRCVLINSFSKTYSMTGWRLGYCAAPPDVIRGMLLVLQLCSRGPATFVQDAGAAALNGPQDCVRDMLDEYTRRRNTVVQRLAGIPNVLVHPPEGGFFAMLDITRTGRTSDDVRRYMLNEHGVAVVHGRAYGEAGEGTLRVSFASGGDVLDRGLHLLSQGLTNL